MSDKLRKHCDHLSGMVEDLACRWIENYGQDAPCAFKSRLETLHYYLRNLADNLDKSPGEIKSQAFDRQHILEFLCDPESQ